jgi:WD40 repeat protein
VSQNEGVAQPDGTGVGGLGQGQEDRLGADLFSQALITSYVDDPRFVPRPWLLERVQEALSSPRARFVLLTAEPGSGKSALMAHLARLHPAWPRHFLRRDSVTALQGGDARTFLFSVGHQLARLHPSLFDPRQLEVVVRQRIERVASRGSVVGIHVEDLQASPFYTTAMEVTQYGRVVEGKLAGMSAGRMTLEPRLLELSNLQYLALVDPADVLSRQDPEASIVVLVDALDEVRYGARGEDVLSWLAASPEFPSNVRFVLTSRPDPDLLGSFRRTKAPELVEHSIDPGEEGDRDRIWEDLRRFLQGFSAEAAVAQAFEAHQVQPASFVEDAANNAEGNFQYAVALARGIDAAVATEAPFEDLPALLRLEGIPSGTTELYRFFLIKVKEEADRTPVKISTGPLVEAEDRPAWDALYRPVLSVLAVAFEPLSSEQLQAYAAAPPGALPRALQDLAQFLDPLPDGRYRLYHATFPEFLIGAATASPADPFHVNPAAGHGLLAGRMLRANPDWLACQDRYALAYTPAHLTQTIRLQTDREGRQELTTALTRLLSNLGFLERKTAVLGIDAVLEDLTTTLEVAPGNPVLLQKYRVLDREAHNLRSWVATRQPQYFAQQVYNGAFAVTADEFASEAQARLEALRKPYLLHQWRTGEEHGALLRTLRGHTDEVWDVALASDGRTVVSASKDHTLRVWDLETGRHVRTLEGHQGTVNAVAIAPDGSRAFSASDDKTLKVWDLHTGVDLKTLVGHNREVTDVCLLADGRRALSASDDFTLKLWDLAAGVTLHTFEGHRAFVTAVAVTADGGRAVSASWDHTVRAWDLIQGGRSVVLGEHDDGVLTVCVTRDSRCALSGSWDGSVRVSDFETGISRVLTGRSEPVHGLAQAPGDQVVAALDDGTLEIWDIKTGARAVLGSHGLPVRGVAVTGDGQRAVSASDDQTLMVWDLAVRGTSGLRSGHGLHVDHVAVSGDGHFAASSSSNDAVVRVWDVTAGEQFWEHEFEEPATALAITHRGARLALARLAETSAGHVQLETWSLAPKKLLRSTERVVGTVKCIQDHWAAAFAHGPESDENILTVLDVQTGRTTREWSVEESRGWPRAMAITPSGQRVVAAFATGSLGYWDVKSGAAQTLPISDAWTWSTAITADGRYAVIVHNTGELEICDLERGAVQSLVPHIGPVMDVTVFGLANAISAGTDGTVRVWDLAIPEELAVLHVESELRCVACSATGSTIVVGTVWGNVHALQLVAPS